MEEKSSKQIVNFDGFDAALSMHFESPHEKRKLSYGLKLAKNFWGNVSVGYNSYYDLRNSNWDNNRKFSAGKITHDEFKDLLGIQGTRSFINIDFDIAKILPKYKEALVAGWMDRDEEPTVKATDILSVQVKQREKLMAKFRMAHKEKIAAAEQMAGKKLETGFTPEDENELDIWDKLENKLPEEAFFKKTIKQIFENNDSDVLKRLDLSDLVEVNCAISKIEKIVSYSKTLSNRIRLRRCKPERCFYNIFESPIGNDIRIIGEAYPMSISEARRRFPKITEEQWFKIAEKAQKALIQSQPLTWTDSWINTPTRPYDDYSFMVFDFEVKTVDKDYYIKTENQYGNTVVIPKKSKPNPTGKQEIKGEIIDNERYNIYCGIWAIDTEFMMEWDVASNMIRPYQNGVDAFMNYTIVMPNADGTYQPSLLERGISNVRAMALYKLKISQMVSLMKADGISIDIDGLQAIDLGNGEKYDKLTLKRVFDQTGEIWWDSGDTTGTGLERKSAPPINPHSNSANVAQINTLIQLYNFELQNLNSEFGVNEDFLGGSVSAKRGAKVSDNQITAANKATEFLYRHYLLKREMEATKIGYMLWDMIVLESNDYKKMAGISSDMIDTTFDINWKMSSKSDDRAKLGEYIQIALKEQIIGLSTAARLGEIDDHKDAILYLERMEKKASQRAQASKQNDIQMNAQMQQQSLQMKAQAEAMIEQAKAQREASTEKAKGDARAYEEMVKMVNNVVIKSMETGAPIPVEISDLMKTIQNNVLNQSIVKPAQKEQAEQQAAQQQAQAQQMQSQQ